MIRKLAFAGAIALGSTAAQADSFNVAIDGHCNTFTLNVQGLLVAGTRGGCEGSAIEGGTVARTDHKRGVIVSETTGGMVVTWYFTTPQGGEGKVYVFGSDGTASEPLGAGHYHIVRSTPASDGAHAAPDIMAEFPRKR